MAISLGASAVLGKHVAPELLIDVLDKHVIRLPGAQSRVLVVEDDAQAGELIAEVLRSSGLLPVITYSGKQALEVLAASPIAAAVITSIMPEMTGFELILRIRLDPKFSRLPLIVLTGRQLDSSDSQVGRHETKAILSNAVPWQQDLLARLDSMLKNVK